METDKINEKFFSTHSSNMFYVLGLIFADGYLHQPKYGKKYVAIKLIDEQILKDINIKMNVYEDPKKSGITSAGNKLYKISFNNTILINDLEKLGLHERKTFTINYPNIPSKYSQDFIRGYFDGDGCIHISKRKGRINSYNKSFSILGTENILKGIGNNLPCESYISKYRKIFRLTVNKEEDIRSIYNFLYNKNTLSLDRKKKHFEYTLSLINEAKTKQESYIKKEQEPRITNSIFIDKAKQIHGERYNYSLIDFVNNNNEIDIICPIHGKFKQLPNKHLAGHNCQKCSGRYMDTEYFIDKAKLIHNNKYDYSKVIYNNNKDKVKIKCFVHGEFEQIPSNHLLGRGCSECGKRSAKRRKQKKEEKLLETKNKTKTC